MDQPNRGKVELVAGEDTYILTATTTELDKAESLLGVNGFDGVLKKLDEGTPISLLLKVAAIFIHAPKENPGDITKDALDAVLTEVGHGPFKDHLLRLCAATYGGRDGLERFDRMRKLGDAARELAIREMEAEAKKQLEKVSPDPNAQGTEEPTASA